MENYEVEEDIFRKSEQVVHGGVGGEDGCVPDWSLDQLQCPP